MSEVPTPLYKLFGDSWPPPKPDPDEEYDYVESEEEE